MNRFFKSFLSVMAVALTSWTWAAEITYSWNNDKGFVDSEGNLAVVNGDFTITAEFKMPNVTSMAGSIIAFNVTKDGESVGSFAMQNWYANGKGEHQLDYIVGGTTILSDGDFSNERMHNSGNGTNTWTITSKGPNNGVIGTTSLAFNFALTPDVAATKTVSNATLANGFSITSVSLGEGVTLESATLKVSTPKPTIWVSFDNRSLGSNTTLSTSSFNALNLSGSVDYVKNVHKADNEALKLSKDGVDSYGSQSFLPNNSTTFTLSLNAIAGTNEKGVLVAFGGIGQNVNPKGGLAIRRGTSVNEIVVTKGTSVDPILTGTAMLCSKDYHHIVVVSDNGTLKLYIDGAPVMKDGEVATATATASELIPTDNIQYGSRHGGTYTEENTCSNGALDELVVWNSYALTAEEVASFYNDNYRPPVLSMDADKDSNKAISTSEFETAIGSGNYLFAVSGEVTLALDSAITWDNVEIRSANDANDKLIFAGSEKFTVTSSNIRVNTTVNAGAASLGTVTIASGKKLSIETSDSVGEVTFEDATSTLELSGENSLTSLPDGVLRKNASVIINAPLKLQDTALAMGTSASSPSITQNITIKKDITATRLLTGNGNDTTTNVNHENGTITLTHDYTGAINEITTNPAVLLGHWPSNTHYQLKAGALLAETGWLALGWGNNNHPDGYNTVMYVGQNASDAGETTAQVKVYGMDGRDRNNKATIQINQTGTLSIGAGGVNLNQQKKHLILSGGTFEAYETMLVQNLPNGLELTATSTLQANKNCDMSIKASIVDAEATSSGVIVKGDGNVIFAKNNTYGGGTTIEENATLRLTEEGTLGNGSVTIKSGGTLSYCRSATPTNAISGAGAIVANGEGVELNLCSATLTDFNGALNATGGAIIKLPYAMTEGKTFSADGTSKLIVVLSNDETDQNNLHAVTVTGSGTLEFVDAAGHTLPSSDSTYVLPTYTVTDDGGSWNVTPLQHSKAVIDFAETTGKKVDLASILGNVTVLTKLTVAGTNGGTINNSTVTACPTVVVTAGGRTNVPAALTSLATTVTGPMAEGSLLYVTGETTSTAQAFPYFGNRHFEKIKFTNQDNVGSGIENYIIAANETMLFTRGNVRYIEALILDGGLLKTSGNNQAWFGGAANKCLTIKSGIADLTSVITDDGTSAVLIGYSSNHEHTLGIQGGLLDASNTSIVGWEANSKYSQSGGLVKTKGFRQNGLNFKEMTLTGGTIELGLVGIPDLGMASAKLGAATIRATADAIIAEALNVTGAATLQAVAGKTLTVSGTISGEGTIAIGGTATTKTRADNGTYTDTMVNATGTVYIGTNRPKIASIAEGATLQIALTDDEVANGISWNVGENLTTEEANRLTVVGATLDNITIADGVLTANLASNLAASWENGVWSQVPVTGSPVTITFSEGHTTCTFTNTEAIELASLTIKGATAGEIVLGEYAVTVSAMTVEPTEVTIPVALFNSFAAQAYTVESGKTLKLTGDADVSKKVDVRGTLVLAGSMNFTAGNYVYDGGKLEVLSGESTFNTGDGRGFQNGCTIKIAKDATLKNGKADAPGYNNVTFDIAGTLEVTGGVRWSLGSTSSTTLREGAVLKGDGSQDSWGFAFDWFDGAKIEVLGNAKVQGNIGTHNADDKVLNFKIASNKTLTISGVVEKCKLKASGSGTLKLTGANTYSGGTEIANGATFVAASATALGTGAVTNNGTLELNAAGVEATIAGSISGSGAMKVTAGTLNLKGANGGYTGTITIESGAILASSGTASIPFTKGSIVNDGTVAINNGHLPPTSGIGNVTFGDGANIAAELTTTGTITIPSGATVNFARGKAGGATDPDFNTNTPSINGGNLIVSGTLGIGGEAGTPTVTIANGKTLSGTGTIEVPLTLSDGASIDATNGAVTVNGAVTLPAEGTVKVKVKEHGDVLLTSKLAGTDVEKFAFAETIENAKLVVTDRGLSCAEIPEVNGVLVPETLMNSVIQAAASEGITKVTFEGAPLATDSEGNPAKTVDVAGLELFNNVVTEIVEEGATEGKAIVSYAFGIQDITIDANNNIVVTAKVDKIPVQAQEGEPAAIDEAPAPTFANDVTVKLYNGETEIGEAQVTEGDQTVTIESKQSLEAILNSLAGQDEGEGGDESDGSVVPAPTSKTLQLTVKAEKVTNTSAQ